MRDQHISTRVRVTSSLMEVDERQIHRDISLLITKLSSPSFLNSNNEYRFKKELRGKRIIKTKDANIH
jgi:hypothetical protein